MTSVRRHSISSSTGVWHGATMSRRTADGRWFARCSEAGDGQDDAVRQLCASGLTCVEVRLNVHSRVREDVRAEGDIRPVGSGLCDGSCLSTIDVVVCRGRGRGRMVVC